MQLINWMFRPASLGVRLAGFLVGAMIALAIIAAFPAHAKGIYVTGFGGANWDDVSYDNGWISAKDSTGYVIGAALGTNIDAVPGLRAEFELSFRSNGIDILICDNPLTATDRTWGFMGNIAYQFDTPKWPVHPYLLVGAGYASRTASLDGYPAELSNQGFAFQGGVGINTAVADGIIVGLEYRVADLPDLDLGDFHSDGVNQSAMLNVTFALN